MTDAVTPTLVREFQERLANARRDIYATVTTTDDELATLEAHQRLRAVPATRYCVACQPREEQ